jgi:hypothetical protein
VVHLGSSNSSTSSRYAFSTRGVASNISATKQADSTARAVALKVQISQRQSSSGSTATNRPKHASTSVAQEKWKRTQKLQNLFSLSFSLSLSLSLSTFVRWPTVMLSFPPVSFVLSVKSEWKIQRSKSKKKNPNAFSFVCLLTKLQTKY